MEDIKVKIIKVEPMDELQGTVTFKINNGHYQAFYYGDNFTDGEEITARLTQLEYPIEWDAIFGENQKKEMKIEKSNNGQWSYYCYGKIISINPIIADFGDFKMDLGNWTSDRQAVGEYIYWNIDRLDIERVK